MNERKSKKAHAIHTKLISNSQWNLVAFAFSLFFNFVTIPFVIKRISLNAFGTAGLVLSILAPLTLVGTVLGQAMLRELSLHFSEADLRSGRRSFSAAMLLCGIGCLLVAVIFLAFGRVVIATFFDTALTSDYYLSVIIAVFGWGLQQFVLIFQSAVAATQKYSLLAKISIVASLVNAALIMGTVTLIPTTIGYLAGMSGGFFVSVIVWVLLVRRNEPWLFPLCLVNKADCRSIIDFGKWQSVSFLVGGIGLQMDRYVLGILTAPVYVGRYNVANRLQEVVHMGVLKAGDVLFPYFSSTSHQPIAQRASFFISISWLLNTFAACALAPLIPLSWHIIALWINQEAATDGATMLCTLTVAGILGCGVNVYSYHAMGAGEVFRLTQLSFITAIVSVVFTAILIIYVGPIAAGGGILVGNAIRLIFVLLFSKKSFQPLISLRTLIVVTTPPLVAGLIMAYAWEASGILSLSSWLSLLIGYVVVSISVAIASVALTSLSAQGRGAVAAAVRATGTFLKQRS